MNTQPSAQTIAWLDQEDQRTAQIIREHGAYIQYVGGDDADEKASFAYTIGLFESVTPSYSSSACRHP